MGLLDKQIGKILVCFLLMLVFSINCLSQEVTLNKRFSNIEVFGKFWSNIYLFHPKIICNDKDQEWYQVFNSEFSNIEKYSSSRELCNSLNKIIKDCSLGNGTKVVYEENDNNYFSDSLGYKYVANNRHTFLYLNLTNPELYYTDDFFNLFSEIKNVSDSVIFILDMRWNSVIQKSEDDITKFYPLRFFIRSEFTRPHFFSRQYQGWNENNYYNVFNQSANVTDVEPLLPINEPEIWLKRWHRQVNFDSLKIFTNNVFFIVNDNSLSYCKGYLDKMQNYDNVFVAYDPITKNAILNSKRQIRLNDSLVLNLCTEELMSSNGGVGFKEDLIVENNSNIEALIFQTNSFLSQTVQNPIIQKMNFDFDISHGPLLESLPMSKNSYFLFFFKMWFVIKYFDPHLELADIPWDTQFTRGIRAVDTCRSDKAFFETILYLTKPINDGHLKISNSYKFQPEAEYSVPLKLRKFRDSYLVIESWDSKVCTGDKIVKIDGESIAEVEKRILAKKSFSTTAAENQWLDFYNQIIRRHKLNEKVKLELESKEGKRIEVTLKASIKPWEVYSNNITKPDTYIVSDSILYFDLTREKSLKNLDSLIMNYSDFKGLILDMRGFNYSFGAREDLIKRLSDRPVRSPVYKVPYITYFDTINHNFIQRQEIVPTDEKINKWKNKVCMLTNNMQKSTPENFLMYLRDLENITFIGQPTCGTNGNVTQIEFPGDFALEFTGMEVLYPNGNNFQNVGIIPDILVEDDLQGLLSNTDLILRMAIDYINSED